MKRKEEGILFYSNKGAVSAREVVRNLPESKLTALRRSSPKQTSELGEEEPLFLL